MDMKGSTQIQNYIIYNIILVLFERIHYNALVVFLLSIITLSS